MAWTAPRTYVAGEIVTAAILNVDHRDNLLTLGPVIEGRVNGDATIAAGSGFSVAHTGTGVYTVTFSTTFSAIPTVMAAVDISGTTNSFVISIAAVSTSSVQIATSTVSTVQTDRPFHFVAKLTV